MWDTPARPDGSALSADVLNGVEGAERKGARTAAQAQRSGLRKDRRLPSGVVIDPVKVREPRSAKRAGDRSRPFGVLIGPAEVHRSSTGLAGTGGFLPAR
ncbi:hypothetical protein GCM10010116_14340 [Microbispora rosea subsp. aerata]|nr:hypothetical protein GCM10010116_14340 [Microbispora rosea subsp. aerata]GLJ83954.1 hypothetical protein GCM10017588_26820 [Microbispora rosea subsp. aerata]